ncbi:hypothetical protein J9874_00883 [Duffyella gerundensis]|jgi:hypothetical protein|uniref:Putative membrane protein n=1 Tax=Duffyella gerundensis TaxID=1619313 RepID=A0A0U5GPU0_9GAMM|nr:hypothetical protein J9874_00883 [Duffyella gerundensis]CUU24802.1 putative membrane protein [Duffyella gerundensis]
MSLKLSVTLIMLVWLSYVAFAGSYFVSTFALFN